MKTELLFDTPAGGPPWSNRLTRMLTVLGVVACLGLLGCGTTAVNPDKPRANTGYVDFYTDSPLELSWEIKRAEPTGGEMRTLFSKFEPVEGTVLRLAVAPGPQRFSVWVMNRVTDGPQTVDASVEDGKVTPIHVTLGSAGTTSVDRKVYGLRPSAKGYARGTKVVTDESEVYRILAEPAPVRPYQPMQQMPYFSAGSK